MLNHITTMSLPVNYLHLINKNIVIVEDDVPSVKYYETLLKNSGAAINIFSNGKSFIDYFTTTNDKIDIVLIDFLIPFVNGIECIKIFRKEERNIPIIMITAYFSDNTKNEAYIAGCNEYILKPIFPEKIFSLLEKYLDPRLIYSDSL
jgi:two-component system sensor histidine kinase/response regulator